MVVDRIFEKPAMDSFLDPGLITSYQKESDLGGVKFAVAGKRNSLIVLSKLKIIGFYCSWRMCLGK